MTVDVVCPGLDWGHLLELALLVIAAGLAGYANGLRRDIRHPDCHDRCVCYQRGVDDEWEATRD